MSFINANLRALLAVMQPLTGVRSAGLIQMTASGEDVFIERGQYAIPVIGGRAAPELLVKADLNPATPSDESPGSWRVPFVGASVGFISNLGGVRYNFPPGTTFLLDPPVDGLTATLLPSAAGFAGGIDASGFGALLDLVIAENLSGPAQSVDLRRSQLTRFPSAVLTWREAIPADGSSVPQVRRGSRAGTRVNLYRLGYTLSVIASRQDTQHERQHEALSIISSLAELITDRQAVDGENLSNPSGVQIQSIRREALPQEAFQRFIIYSIDLNCTVTLCQRDSREYAEWLVTHLCIEKPDPVLGPLPVVDCIDIPMQGGALTVEGDPVLIDGRPVILEGGG